MSKSKIWAYLRVSTDKQETLKNRDEITAFLAASNLSPVDEWIEEIASGKKKSGLRELGPAIDKMQTGDTLIVSEISRIARESFDAASVFGKLMDKGCRLLSCKQSALRLTGDATDKFMLMIYAYLAESEANLISQRTKQALQSRKARGQRLGRPVGSRDKRTNLVLTELKNRLEKGERVKDIMSAMNMNPGSFYHFKSLL